MIVSICDSLLIVLACLVPANSIAEFEGGRACERSNLALCAAHKLRAEADYQHRIAACLADAECNLAESLAQAATDRREQLALAEQVFLAREQACALFGHQLYLPEIMPLQFGTAINHPYMPLVPGQAMVHRRETAKGVELVRTTVLEQTVEIGGVSCREVVESEALNGVLVAQTRNWIAQHRSGAVWYFGEYALNYSDGLVDDMDGSWRFGKDGAQAGLLMPAAPAVGQVYRQEFLLGDTENIARVLRMDATVQVPAGAFQNCVMIEEWDPLDPLEYIWKFFAPNVGLVLEVDPRSGERLELIEIN